MKKPKITTNQIVPSCIMKEILDYSNLCVRFELFTCTQILNLLNFQNILLHFRETALQLGIGPLLKEFLQNMQLSVDGNSSVKMRLFSGHDTTLMPLLRALGLEESFWTPYGANITLELYEDTMKNNKADHFVRILYQHEERLVPGCDGIMCPIEKFRDVVSKYILDDDEYVRKCAVKDDQLLKSVPKIEKSDILIR